MRAKLLKQTSFARPIRPDYQYINITGLAGTEGVGDIHVEFPDVPPDLDIAGVVQLIGRFFIRHLNII